MMKPLQSRQGELAKAFAVLFKARVTKYKRKYMGPHGWVYVYDHDRGHEHHQRAIPLPGRHGDRGWTDYAQRDGRVLKALRRAHGVAEVEDIIRHVRHREFAVGLDSSGRVVAVGAGPLSDRRSTDHPNLIANRARNVARLPPQAGVRTVVVTHNHPAGTPPSESDLVSGMRAGARSGLEHLHVATWYGSWVVDTSTKTPDPDTLGVALHAALMVAWERAQIRAPANALTENRSVGTLQVANAKVVHDFATKALKEIARIAQDPGEDALLRRACKLAGRRVRFRPA